MFNFSLTKRTQQRKTARPGFSQMQLQKSLEHYQKIPKSVVLQHIDVWADTFLGVRIIFARILPNLTEKKTIKESDLQKNKKASSSWYFGRQFCWYCQMFAQIFRAFVKVFRDFAQIYTDFPLILTKSKLLGKRFAPLVAPPPTPVVQHKIGVLW